MCDPTLIVAGLSLVGGGLQYKAQNDALEKQQRIASQAEESQLKRQSQQQNLILDNAEGFDPTKRAASLEETAQVAQASLGEAVAQANSAAPQSDAGATGRVSEEFQRARANSVAQQTAKAAETARLMSRVRAPTDLLGTEQLDYADVLGQVGTLGSKAGGEWKRDMARVQGVRPNQGLLFLGDALKAGGTMFGLKANTPGGF